MSKNYDMIRSTDEFAKFCQKLIQDGLPFGFDIETGYHGEPKEKHSLHPETAFIVGLSFANDTSWARYAPFMHDLGPNLDPKTCAKLFWAVLQTGLGVAHNAKFELRHMRRWFLEHLSDDPDYGEAVQAARGYFPVLSCTMIEAFTIAEERSYGLKSLTFNLFNHKMTELMELFPGLAKNKMKTLRFNVLELTPKVVEYACEDSLWALAVHNKYYPQVKDRLLYKTDMYVINALCEMEDYGVKFDWLMLRRHREEAIAFLGPLNEHIMSELTKMNPSGDRVAINLGSAAQVSKVLYGQIGLKTSVYTANTKNLPQGQRKMSTGKIALTGLAMEHEAIDRILQWKQLKKLISSYLEKFERDFSYAPDGMTHPDHLQAAVISGRFAVSDPMYNGLPKKYHLDLPTGEEFDMNFRNVVVAPQDHYILGFDYSQIELRVIAGEAQEPALLKAFRDGVDVHRTTAALMLGIPVDQVDDKQRAIGKTMNFALLYGMQVKSLAERLGIPKQQAQQLYDKYFSAFSSISVWIDRQQQFGKANGYVKSRFGRRIPIWEFGSTERWIYQKGERLCINAPIQGSAADYVKIAMARVHKALKAAGLSDRVHMVMNIHDALEFYVHRDVTPQDVMAVLADAVVFPIKDWPPMKAEWHLGLKWGALKEIDISESGALIIKGEAVKETIDEGDEDDEDGEESGPALPAIDVDVLKQVIETPVADVADPLPSLIPDTMDADAAVNLANEMDEIPLHTDNGEPPKQVIVEISTMPDEGVFRRFLALLKQSKGPHTLELRTPEGTMPFEGTSLTPADQAAVSMIFGGAKVTYAAEDVDASALVSGLTL